MRKTTINELVKLNGDLEKNQLKLLQENQFIREAEEEKIEKYIILLNNKISSLKGKRNINKLSKIKGKWERILFEKIPRFERITSELLKKSQMKVKEKPSKSIEIFFERVEQRIIEMTKNLIPERERINSELFEDYI